MESDTLVHSNDNGKPKEAVNHKEEEIPLMLPYIVSDKSIIEYCGLILTINLK